MHEPWDDGLEDGLQGGLQAWDEAIDGASDDAGEYSEMYGEPTSLVPPSDLVLADLGGPGAELSTGLILTWRHKLVFGFDPRAVPLGAAGQPSVLAFVGVGGHLEPGESWEQAVVREAREEASCDVALGDSPITYLCREREAPRPIAHHWTGPQRPLLVWVANFTLHRGPERRLTPVTFVNAVFRAAALGRPAPASEMSGLLLLDHDLLRDCLAAPRPFGELLARGAEVIGTAPAADTLVAPGGSAYFFAQWLAWQA